MCKYNEFQRKRLQQEKTSTIHILIYYDQSLGRGREGVFRIIFSRAKWLSTNIKMTKLKKKHADGFTTSVKLFTWLTVKSKPNYRTFQTIVPINLFYFKLSTCLNKKIIMWKFCNRHPAFSRLLCKWQKNDKCFAEIYALNTPINSNSIHTQPVVPKIKRFGLPGAGFRPSCL